MQPAPDERGDPTSPDLVELFGGLAVLERLLAERQPVALPINYAVLGGADRQRVVPGAQCEYHQAAVAQVLRDHDRDGSDLVVGGLGLTQAPLLRGFK